MVLAKDRGPWWLLGAAAIGVVLGFIAGWFAHTWMTCRGGSCSFDTALFDATGTWFAGIVTAGAVVIAGFQFSSETRHRQRQERRESHKAEVDQARLAADADRVSVTVRLGSWASIGGSQVVSSIRVWIHNGSPRYEALDVTWDVAGRATGEIPLVGVLDNEGSGRKVDDWDRFTDGSTLEENEAMTERTTITFVMGEKRWRRTGAQPVEQIPDS